MHIAPRDPAALSIDRTSRRAHAPALLDRCALAMLDAYGELSQPFKQRGLYRACRLIGRLLWKDRNATLVLGPDARLSFPASDPYWNRMLLRSYDHEPEMARFLRQLAPIDYSFIDCGANIGYWSVFVASHNGGGKPVLAVEASAQTFALLETNTSPHADTIKTFHRAILDRSDVEVRLNDAAHEARGIANGGDGSGSEAVQSIAIDDLIEQKGWWPRRLVVKLDVEGVEREALAGMERALANDALVIYEDHGSDRSHALTRHLREERGFDVHLLLDDRAIPIGNASELDAFKLDHTKGYNLVAVRPGSQWTAILR